MHVENKIHSKDGAQYLFLLLLKALGIQFVSCGVFSAPPPTIKWLKWGQSRRKWRREEGNRRKGKESKEEGRYDSEVCRLVLYFQLSCTDNAGYTMPGCFLTFSNTTTELIENLKKWCIFPELCYYKISMSEPRCEAYSSYQHVTDVFPSLFIRHISMMSNYPL